MDYKAYSMIMKALGDETRVKIFDMLSDGERCACKLLDEFSVTQPTLSYHMKILCDCGLVAARRDGIWMRYTVRQEVLADMIGFLNRVASGVPEGIERCDCKEAAQ